MHLYNSDSLEVMKSLDNESVDLVLTDPPYGITDLNYDKPINLILLWQQIERILTPAGTAIFFANSSFTAKIISSNVKLYKYCLIWCKKNKTLFTHAKNRPLSSFEQILIFSKGSIGHKNLLGDKRMTYNPQGLKPLNKTVKGTRNEKASIGNLYGVRKSHKEQYTQEFYNYPNDLLYYDSVKNNERMHPSEKPLLLLEWLINSYSNTDNTVLDPFMGSCSTGVACFNTNRKFIGIELDKNYFELGKNRLENAVHKQSLTAH